ncbi:MAG TPA: SigB/SigF/SigG family RNA polymerase sigma factor [Streptosporangiaceae bacterium]|nr:SigB/SigF/SigG family RNA polymerase sigma factor [Streptosporangiaceae bacterium]
MKATAVRPETPATGALGTCSDDELLELVQSAPRGSGQRDMACAELVSRYQPLVRSCAQRYRKSPEPQEDLMQVGYVGLLKAINNFDPELGGDLAAYAQPCISGEIKRHFRDKRWQVHVRRSAQELLLEVRAATAQLTQTLGHPPKDSELADHLRVSDEDVRDARRADMVMRPCSLDAPVHDGTDSVTLADVLGDDDPAVEFTLNREAVSAHWDELPVREQRILVMRFYGNMTQAEIGQRLGISQMHVSRLLTRALGYLRECLTEPGEPAS